MEAGSIAEWLGVGVAVLGLFVGAASGAFYGAVRRMRLEDRRILLDGYVTPLRQAPQVWPPSNHGLLSYLLEGDDAGRRVDAVAIRGLYFAELVNTGTDIVRLLPWPDRALWSRVLDVPESTAAEGLASLIETVRYAARGTHLRDARTPSDAAKVALSSMGWDEWNDRLATFEGHLRRKLNPTWTARWLNTRTKLDLWKSGPRPWSKTISPTVFDAHNALTVPDRH